MFNYIRAVLTSKNESEVQQNRLDEINQNRANEKIFQAQIMRSVLNVASNISEIKKEVNDLAQLKNVNQLKDLISLQSGIKTLQQGLLQVNITQQARGQDFLALYNMTLYLRSLSEEQGMLSVDACASSEPKNYG